MFIELGIISKPHGFRGEFIVAKCQGHESALGIVPRIFFESTPTAAPHAILEAAWMPKGWKLKVEGIESVPQVDALRGTAIFASREDLPSLPADEFYVGEITGAIAIDEASGKEIGTFLGVEALSPAGGSDRWWFKIEGEEMAVPAIRRFIAGVDAKKKTIRLQNLHELRAE